MTGCARSQTDRLAGQLYQRVHPDTSGKQREGIGTYRSCPSHRATPGFTLGITIHISPEQLYKKSESLNSMYQQRPATVGVSIGAFGVAFTFLTTALLILIPQELMSPATSSTFIETWSRPIMTIGQGMVLYGIPLLSAVFAYYLTTKSYATKSVVTGFIIGGLVFGFGDALLGETVLYFFAEDPAFGQSLTSHVYDLVELGGRLVGGALIGILGAIVIMRGTTKR